MNAMLRAIPLAVATLVSGHAAAAVQTAWSSGASAPTKAVFNAFRSNCSGGNVTVYQRGATSGLPGDSGTGNFFAYQCTFDPAKTAVFGGDTVTLFHTVDGGSFNAFSPYLNPANPNRKTNLQRITDTFAGCTALGSPEPGVTLNGNCSLVDPSIEPDGGFSDVEDDLFPDLMTSGENFTTSSANVAQVFGVAVTDALYSAMQTAQGTTGQPSISKQGYLSIASQSASGAWHTDWSPLVGAAGAGKAVNLCRRVDTSGTQASSNAFFLENPCRKGALGGFLMPSKSSDSVPGQYIVTENSGTGDVKACLNNANTAGSFAIGVMSAENVRGGSDGFQFVKVDGVSPNLDPNQRKTGADGTYSFVMETVYVVHNSAMQGLFDELAGDMGNPAVTDLKGLFVLPTTATPDGDKVGRGTKFGNNCQPQQLFF